MDALQPVSPDELTRLLNCWSQSDDSALDRLTPLVYSELRRLAGRSFAGERDGHLLQPSALVNEAFVRLVRQILIDFARGQETAKRGHRSPHLDVSHIEDLRGENANPVDLIDLDRALNELALLNERHARVIELRYVGGFENVEVASVLGISDATVVRDWHVSRAWLFDRLNGQSLQP